MDKLTLEKVFNHLMYAKGKNSKHSVKKVGNTGKHRSYGKYQKKSAYSVKKENYRFSKYERSSSTSSSESSPEPKWSNERSSRSRTRRTCKSSQSQASKSSNKQDVAQKKGEFKAVNSNNLSVLGKKNMPASIFPSKSYGGGQNFSFPKSKSAFRTSTKHPGKSVSFKTTPMSSGRIASGIKTTSGHGIYNCKLGKGWDWLKVKPRIYDSNSTIPKNNLAKDEDLHKLPCGESGKWKYIRMYQERARRREARRRRQRQKAREEASGKKSTRRRKKSKKKSKSKRRRSRSKRRKSTTRRSSGVRRRRRKRSS